MHGLRARRRRGWPRPAPTRPSLVGRSLAGATGSTGPSTSRASRGRAAIGWSAPPGPARCGRFRSSIEQDLLERHTLADVLHYFKGQRSSGLIDLADHALPLEDRPQTRVDAHGGWYDATGDYGKHLSHLSFSTYFNPQQLSLTAWGLLETTALLESRGDPAFRQYLRLLRDEAAWGADYLVRVQGARRLVLSLGLRPRSGQATRGPPHRPRRTGLRHQDQGGSTELQGDGNGSHRDSGVPEQLPRGRRRRDRRSGPRRGDGDQGRAERRLPARRRGRVGFSREAQRVAHQRRAREHRRRLLRAARGDRALPRHAQAGLQGSRGRAGLAPRGPSRRPAPTRLLAGRRRRLAPSSTPPTPGCP